MIKKCPFMSGPQYINCMGKECQLWINDNCSLGFGEAIYEHLQYLYKLFNKPQEDGNADDNCYYP